MDEFSLSEVLVTAVLEEMSRLSPSVVLHRAHAVVGALRRVTPESLRVAYELQTRDTRAAGSYLDVTLVPEAVLCGDCGWQGESEDPLPACGRCSGTNLTRLKGMELYISDLEVEDREA